MLSICLLLILPFFGQIVVGAPVAQAQSDPGNLAPITAAVTNVSTYLSVLDAQIQTLSVGNVTGALSVFNTASQFQQSMVVATTQINAVPGALSLIDALMLQNVATSLASQIQTTMNDLITKEPVVASLGATAQIALVIQAQQLTSRNLSDAIVAKVPSIGQSIAQQLVTSITSPINQAVQVYAVAAISPAPTAPGSTSNSTAAPVARNVLASASTTCTGFRRMLLSRCRVNQVVSPKRFSTTPPGIVW